MKFFGYNRFALVLVVLTALLFPGCNRKTQVVAEKLSDEPVIKDSSFESGKDPERAPLTVIHPDEELLLMVRSDYEPFMWKNENGELTGWLVDVEKAVWEELGQKIAMVPYTDAGKATQDVKSGVAHALVGTPYTPDYEKILNIGDPWVFLDLMIFVNQDNTDIGGSSMEECIQSLSAKRVGVQVRGIELNLLREYKNIELVEYETGTVAIRKMAEGAVDAKLEIMQPALYQANKEKLSIKPVGVPLMTVEGSLGFYKGLNPEIIRKYNQGISTIHENGTYDRIYEKWFGN